MTLSKAERKHIQLLSTKKGRKEQNLFLVSGIRLLEEAHRHRYLPELVLFAESELTERSHALLAAFRAKRLRIESVSARELGQLADTVTPQGVAAVFAPRLLSFEELLKLPARTSLVCENLSDPGNVGTLCRSALAFGCNVMAVIGATAEPFSAKVVRSSAGAVFGLPIAHITVSELFLWRQTVKGTILAADGTGKRIDQTTISQVMKQPVMICVGSEADGLSPELRSGADMRVRIDHEASVESLNAAMAGTILLRDLYQARNVSK